MNWFCAPFASGLSKKPFFMVISSISKSKAYLYTISKFGDFPTSPIFLLDKKKKYIYILTNICHMFSDLL